MGPSISIIVMTCLTQAEEPPRPSPAAEPPKGTLEERLRALEAELERLKLEKAAEEELAKEDPGEKPGAFSGLLSALNPSLTLIANAFARIDDKAEENEDGERIDDQVNLREVELDARAAVDPYADGVIILAFESEFPGEGEAGVEEAYVVLKRLPFLEEPPLGMKLRGGRFRPAFGRMNVLHTHDLPQTIRPLAVQEFLGEEGFHADGGSLELFVPTPWDPEGSVDVSLQAVSSGGAAVAEDARGDFAYLGHLRWFRAVRDAHSLDLGFSGYWGPTGGQGSSVDVLMGGIDVFYKWKPLRGGERRSLLLGGEVFAADREFREEEDVDGDGDVDRARSSPLGFYLMAQYQLGPRLYAGIRWDWTESIEDDRIEESALVPYVSYYLSEFLRLRINHQHLWSDREEDDGRDTVFFELNFLIGAHPPHPFWVNR